MVKCVVYELVYELVYGLCGAWAFILLFIYLTDFKWTILVFIWQNSFKTPSQNPPPAGPTLHYHQLNDPSCFIWLHKLNLTSNESSWSVSEQHPSAVLDTCPPVSVSVKAANLYPMPRRPVNGYGRLLRTRQLVKAVHPKQTPQTQGDVSKTQGGPWKCRRMRRSLRNPFSLTLPSRRTHNSIFWLYPV